MHFSLHANKWNKPGSSTNKGRVTKTSGNFNGTFATLQTEEHEEVGADKQRTGAHAGVTIEQKEWGGWSVLNDTNKRNHNRSKATQSLVDLPRCNDEDIRRISGWDGTG